MTPRLCLSVFLGSFVLIGCTDRFNSGPITYTESPQLRDGLNDKPRLRSAVRSALVEVFGESPQEMRVPSGSGLPNGGIFLANYVKNGKGEAANVKPIAYPDPSVSSGEGGLRLQEGGYKLYRLHCLHCHGVSGAGDGPTAEFLFPRPRDYRKGLYKFTSTPNGAKPTRADLYRTIKNGLHGTSMPAFEALMTDAQIQQVIDYVIFLSARGETEVALVEEALNAEEQDAENAVNAEIATEIAQSVFNKWKAAEGQVVDPPMPRVADTRESILRGRELFLGLNKTGNKVECAGCHGVGARGDGPSFIEERVFQDVVFRFKPLDQAISSLYHAETPAAHHEEGHAAGESISPADQAGVAPFLKNNLDLATYFHAQRGLLPELSDEAFRERLEQSPEDVAVHALELAPDLADPNFRAFLRSKFDLWNKGSLDDWGNPIRPANLLKGIYKGGRRPIDLYWRLAKGINGAKMPSHYPTLPPEQIWDLVNFILVLPYEPDLVRKTEAIPGTTSHMALNRD